MSWAKDPKDLYDVRVHRFGEKVAEEKALEEKESLLKSQPWKKNTPEQQQCITTGDGKAKVETLVSGKIKYSVDELTVAIVLYGKASSIYKAMVEGEKVSLLIRASIEEKLNQGKTKDEIEQRLLIKCLKTEKEFEI